ncbi:hypothetical protein [Flindersiella endophytica]
MSWLDDDVILYDGQTHTKHLLTNAVINAEDKLERLVYKPFQHLAGAPGLPTAADHLHAIQRHVRAP